MARALPSAAVAAQAWQQGFGAAGPKWAAGIDAVTTAPGVLAADSADRYVQGVNSSVAKWKAKVGAVSLQSWKDTAKAKGASRLASGAAAGMVKYQQGIQRVLDAERSILPSLPPRGTVAQNIARSAAFQQAMHDAFANG